MRVSDATLAEVRERGFSLVEGFLGPEELAAAQDALWLHFPKPSDYFADPARFARYGASQFAGVEEFPYRSWDLNRLAVHPDLVDMAERYLQTDRAPSLQGGVVGQVRRRRRLRPATAP